MIDYMVMEAVAIRVRQADVKAEKAAERERWKEEQKKRLQEEVN